MDSCSLLKYNPHLALKQYEAFVTEMMQALKNEIQLNDTLDFIDLKSLQYQLQQLTNKPVTEEDIFELLLDLVTVVNISGCEQQYIKPLVKINTSTMLALISVCNWKSISHWWTNGLYFSYQIESDNQYTLYFRQLRFLLMNCVLQYTPKVLHNPNQHIHDDIDLYQSILNFQSHCATIRDLLNTLETCDTYHDLQLLDYTIPDLYDCYDKAENINSLVIHNTPDVQRLLDLFIRDL